MIYMTLPRKSKNLAGLTFGKITAIGPLRVDKFNRVIWHCKCSCGGDHEAATSALTSGETASCGCLPQGGAARVKHGQAVEGQQSRTYSSWLHMKSRCNSPSNKYYANYGGRGITYDPRWNDFKEFLADMGDRPDGLTLDRIDVNGNYGPANCRWATFQEQMENTRRTIRLTAFGKTQTMANWSRELGISQATIAARLRAGKSHEMALTTQMHQRMQRR